ncbi:hypothetical protein HOLleu_39670 [Holothuria leucospilota]|uniref:Uncharacterized protein n=1 Tax=Holothuria leucospilota TaxID=206669 RepID=A0A9Q0YH81_HOLLE|nr:hypothetical protein HOLleu_39670 [Holothuria leucospilota]
MHSKVTVFHLTSFTYYISFKKKKKQLGGIFFHFCFTGAIAKWMRVVAFVTMIYSNQKINPVDYSNRISNNDLQKQVVLGVISPILSGGCKTDEKHWGSSGCNLLAVHSKGTLT